MLRGRHQYYQNVPAQGWVQFKPFQQSVLLSWLTPSACSWSTQTHTMRKRSSRWGTLPYLIDGAHKITQSNAILRYIARKHNLCGETEEEKCRMDILENEVMDTRLYFARMCYNPDFEKLKPGYLEGLPDKMKLYSQFLGKRPWFAGEKLTYVDFLAYDILDILRIFEPKCLDAFPNLKEFMARFEGLKKISAYMKSSRFLPAPLFLKTAVWANK
ncbi:glutathione S-transferase Mu 1-like isoform X2 [Mirounga angustirostris]|uniref:glutathione S-transferase Mu 1-like isoform X1 n=1 Tax=Mirounga leonina TaxID=9715 RepID=UPI00156C2B37|nr:glutathione S-transferase Mu 1-like isoform X1 [Mirounga leonina]